VRKWRATDAEKVPEVLGASGRDHAVLFYASDADLAGQAREHLLGAGDSGTAIVIATPEHRRLIGECLAWAGVDVPGRSAAGALVTLDASQTMASFMVGGWPDAAAFWQTMSPVLKRALARPGPVRIIGEMVAMLWDDGQRAAAVDLEALWNELARQYSFALLCTYPASGIGTEEDGDELAQINAAHSAASGRFDPGLASQG
jgi:MEDS: MEthanogen/methylotroph, DcmR Sensory domain